MCTDVIYLDFRKAFDSVPHDKLLMKLWNMGISGDLWMWFRSYLNGRQQVVSINNHLSEPLPVHSGVPQGSILGPLLFLIFVNELPTIVQSTKLLLFADDTKCYSASSLNGPALLQADVDIYISGVSLIFPLIHLNLLFYVLALLVMLVPLFTLQMVNHYHGLLPIGTWEF